ncbi:hypothetical protein [Alloactinosynnema sp. L-07]|uniref:hypothetical protein n=1 Tax=Alloactinosynnema sp. L-07 TaxID=1653480 RepID=UPI0006B65261|nr:hypothetical protein [Alloactinosynnema sp. L-07]
MRADLRFDWTIPEPTGALDRFMGPGKSRGETAVEVVGGVVAAGLIGWFVWRTGGVTGWRLALVAVLALDLAGGVLTNATNSAKRWYHRLPAARPRLVFVSAHVLHLAAVAAFLGGTWTWFLVNALLLLGSAVLIESMPVELRRPVAMALLMALFLINLGWLPAVLAWFPALFYLKLLVCHLVPEAPLHDR